MKIISINSITHSDTRQHPFQDNTISKNRAKQKTILNRKEHNNPSFYNIAFNGYVTSSRLRDISIEHPLNILKTLKPYTAEEVSKIIPRVTNKTKPFLNTILNIGKNIILPATCVISLLDYINKDDTDSNEVKEKINNYKKLPKIVNNFGYNKSILADHLDAIPAEDIVDLLKSDLLLNTQDSTFNSFNQVYNYVTKYFDHTMKKKAKANAKVDMNREAMSLIAPKNKLTPSFTQLLLLNHVFDESVCNELLYNRAKYVTPIYIPRLKTLNHEDLKILRRIQTSAVTDKENKGGDIAVYEISLDDKISALNLLSTNREIINSGDQGLLFSDYFKPVDINNPDGNFKVYFQRIKIDLMNQALKHIGIDPQIVDKYMQQYMEAYIKDPSMKNHRDKFWDINYAHLLTSPLEFNESRNPANREHVYPLRDIIINATTGNFKNYIFKESPFAKINEKNRIAFTNVGLDFDKWLNPTIEPIKNTFKDLYNTKEKTFTVKMWNRCPQESLFDGNYTTCCTGIDKDQGASFLQFIQNACTTTLEVRTEKNKVIAMSRILMAKIDGKLSMVVENIEVNNKMAKHYLYNDETKYKFREMIFDYARNLAKNINTTNKDIPVYFSGKYFKVKDIQKGLKGIQMYDDFELIGEFPNMFYINSLGGPFEKDRFADDGDLKLALIDITKKAKPVFSNTTVEESDSNYNHADVENYR